MSADAERSLLRDPLRAFFRLAWPNLPALLLASVLVCVGATLTVLVNPGITPVSVLAAALLVGGPLAALVRVAVEMWQGRETGARQALRFLPACAGSGVRVALVPAVPLALTLVSLEVWAQSRQLWVLVPLAVGGAVTVIVALAACVALPLVLCDGSLRGGRLWLTALRLVARRPVRVLAVPAVAALGVQACTSLTASLALLVPAPVALVMAAAALTQTTRWRNVP